MFGALLEEISAVPVYCYVFVPLAVVDALIAAAPFEDSDSSLLSLARRALRLTDRDVFLEALGLRLVSVGSNYLAKYVKMTNVVEQVFIRMISHGRGAELREPSL
jgi:hypothetical protein